MDDLVVRPSVALASGLESARTYAAASRSEATRRAYTADWRTFETWCAEHGAVPLPVDPSTLACYLAALADAGRRASTIARALAGISEAHRAVGLESPRSASPVRAVMQGIRNTLGVAPRQKAPILPDDLRSMLATLPSDLRGSRDRALLLVGFAAALRRSELVALDVEDVTFGARGLTIVVRRSKTDQVGAGRKVAVPTGVVTCPAAALRSWLDAARISSGALFRPVVGTEVCASRLSSKAVARTVKRVARAAGLDPSSVSGHSLRAGLATAAAMAGRGERAIAAQTGHRSTAVLRGYIRDADLFRDNAAAGLL